MSKELFETNKRLSESELAAEYWAADTDCLKAEKYGASLNPGDPALEKMRTIYRFFNRSHASDSDYQ